MVVTRRPPVPGAEKSVAFIGFDDEEFTFAKSRGGAGLVDCGRDDQRGIEMCRSQTDATIEVVVVFPWRQLLLCAYFQAHQLRQHFGARDMTGIFFLVSFDTFGIVSFDCRRSPPLRAHLPHSRLVAFVNGWREILQAFGNVRWLVSEPETE